MRKILFFLTALTLSTGLWANAIEYTATDPLNLEEDAFDLGVDSHAFNSETGKGYIHFYGDVTTIRDEAFMGCSVLTSITLPNTITTISEAAFAEVGTPEAPVTLILPDDWNYAAAPVNNTTAWHGGYFNSNLYSTEGETDKQDAIATISAIISDYPTSTYLQSLLTEEKEKINDALNRPAVNETKQAATDRLKTTVAIYAEGFSEGQADALGEMGTAQTGCAAVEVTKGDKTVRLYAPEEVKMIQISANE